MLQLYGNPGDYAWGQGGLDAVITEVSDTRGIDFKELAPSLSTFFNNKITFIAPIPVLTPTSFFVWTDYDSVVLLPLLPYLPLTSPLFVSSPIHL